eukprot:171230-Pelagomonas_calceolata.AAC.4
MAAAFYGCYALPCGEPPLLCATCEHTASVLYRPTRQSPLLAYCGCSWHSVTPSPAASHLKNLSNPEQGCHLGEGRALRASAFVTLPSSSSCSQLSCLGQLWRGEGGSQGEGPAAVLVAVGGACCRCKITYGNKGWSPGLFAAPPGHAGVCGLWPAHCKAPCPIQYPIHPDT